MTDYLDLVLSRVRGGGGLRERPRTRFEPGGGPAGGGDDLPVAGEGGAGAGTFEVPGRPRGEVLGRVAPEERPGRGGSGDGVARTGTGVGTGEPRRVRPSTTSLRSAAPGAVAVDRSGGSGGVAGEGEGRGGEGARRGSGAAPTGIPAQQALEPGEPRWVGGAPARVRGREAGREPVTGPEPRGAHPGAGFPGAFPATTGSGGRPAPVGEVPEGSGHLMRRSRPAAGAADPGSGGSPDAMVPRLRPVADPPRPREEHTPAPTSIQVRIGRVEVTAPRGPATPRPVAAPAPRSPALSLDEYLRRRGGGRP